MNGSRDAQTGKKHSQETVIKARAFLDAVHEVHRTGREPSPVRAARAGLVPAWAAWVTALEKHKGQRRDDLRLNADKHYGAPHAHRAALELFLNALGIDNPSFMRAMAMHDRTEFDSIASLAMTAALYQVRPHAVIEPTAALQTWLAHTDIGQDVPASLLQLPFPAVYIRFGPDMARAVDDTLWEPEMHPISTGGVYVFETIIEGRRCLTFVAIGVDTDQGREFAQPVQVAFVDPDESLIEAVIQLEKRAGIAPGTGSNVAMVQMCAKVLLYLQTEDASRIDEVRPNEVAAQVSIVNGKKVSKMERRLRSRYSRIIVGPAQLAPFVLQHTSGEMKPHWRRGHMRMQAHGPQYSLRKLIFIAPTLISADRLNEAVESSGSRR